MQSLHMCDNIRDNSPGYFSFGGCYEAVTRDKAIETIHNVVSAANPAKNVVVQITDTGALGSDDLLDLSAGAMKQLTGKAFNRVPVNIYPCHPGGK